jgi:hypothetical protein
MWVVNTLLLLWMIFAPSQYQGATSDGYQLYMCSGTCSTPQPDAYVAGGRTNNPHVVTVTVGAKVH